MRPRCRRCNSRLTLNFLGASNNLAISLGCAIGGRVGAARISMNPFHPGKGLRPLYLAGRTRELDQFARLCNANTLAQNAVILGLRGTGKTVLLEQLKAIAQANGWLWAGSDLFEYERLTEDSLARRMVIHLSTLLSTALFQHEGQYPPGDGGVHHEHPLHSENLAKDYDSAPGLPGDKLKAVFAKTKALMERAPLKGIVFAFDEAQNLCNAALPREAPLSMLVDVFSYFQRAPSGCRFMLVLSGLPTLYQSLYECRTYKESTFEVMKLQQLEPDAAREAIVKPLELSGATLNFSQNAVDQIIVTSDRYPFFIQFICREAFDTWRVKIGEGEIPFISTRDILHKLDLEFFAPKWTRATERRQDFMHVIASIENSDREFSVQDIVSASQRWLRQGFNASHATQILQNLAEKGFVYKNRRAGYCFAIPLLGQFMRRQPWDPSRLRNPGS